MALYKSIIIIIIIMLQKIANNVVFVDSRISSRAEFPKNICQLPYSG